MKRLTTILLLCVCLPASSSSQDTASKKLLIRLEADFARAVAKHGRAAFVTYFAENGVELQDGGGITTREEMKKQQPWPEGTSLTWTPVHADMAGTGDLGYTYGNYVFKSKDKAGKVIANYGKYVSIWKKQKDGTWKVVVDMGNSSPEPK